MKNPPFHTSLCPWIQIGHPYLDAFDYAMFPPTYSLETPVLRFSVNLNSTHP